MNDQESNVSPFKTTPEVDTDISGASRDEASKLLNDAIDRLNDLAANDPTISFAREAFMLARFGKEDIKERSEEDETRWYACLSEFYMNLFLGAARVQDPFESAVARGLDLLKGNEVRQSA